MNFKLLKTLADRKKAWFCILFALTSCNIALEKTQEAGKSIPQMSQEVCECFSKQKVGDTDTKLSPCINRIVIGSHAATLKEVHSYQDSINAVDTINAMALKDMRNASEIMNDLVISCDVFGVEVETMYDKRYPVDSSVNNLAIIKQLSSTFENEVDSDTTAKIILQKLIAKNIEARRLKEGLRRCNQMKVLYKEEEGAYFASAFIYQLQQKYPLAINELEQEIYFYNKPDLKLIVKVIQRKSQRNKY